THMGIVQCRRVAASAHHSRPVHAGVILPNGGGRDRSLGCRFDRRSSTMTVIPQITAHNGFSVPVLGFGTYGLRGEAGAAAVTAALEAGYRLVDTAFNYENEGAVGHGIASASVDRAAVIVTTKLPGRHHSSVKARESIDESRFRLGGEPTDLHLIHWPNPSQDEYVQAWTALVAAQQRGSVRQIG